MRRDHHIKALFCLAAIVILLFVHNTIAESVFRITVGNVAPVVNASIIECNEPVVLTAASTTRIRCNITVSDRNGWQDIYSVSAKLWYNNTANESDSDSYKNHYTQRECNLTTGNENSRMAYCWFDVQFFADPGEWTFKFNATDKAGEWNAANVTNITIVDFLALSATGVINFGQMLPGETSTASETATINNTCNKEIDIQVNSESDITCTSGKIQLGKVHYDTVDAVYTDMCGVLSTSVGDTCNALSLSFNLPKSNTISGMPVIPTKNTYWRISISEGVSGTCNGTLTFTAKVS